MSTPGGISVYINEGGTSGQLNGPVPSPICMPQGAVDQIARWSLAATDHNVDPGPQRGGAEMAPIVQKSYQINVIKDN